MVSPRRPALRYSRRRVLVAGVALPFALGGCAERASDKVQERDPGAAIESFAAGMAEDDLYRNPDAGERSRARAATRFLLAEPHDLEAQAEAFGDLGFSARHGIDPVTRRPFSLFITLNARYRAWGALLVDRSAPPRVVIEVPHPRFDINTESMGVALHRQVPGSVLLVAGAYRTASDGAADVAHNSRSLFHVLATEFARDGLPQLQLHGYADRNLPDAQVVVSAGAGPANRLARGLASGLEEAGLIICRAWSERCGRLEGTGNVQGQAADDLDVPFLHLEFGYSVRRDPAARDLVVRTIAAELAAD